MTEDPVDFFKHTPAPSRIGKMRAVGADVVYEIARYDSGGASGQLLERVQLRFADGALRLQDADGNETPCKGVDIAAALSSIASLREVREGECTRISCDVEIVTLLPFVLEPIWDGGGSPDLPAEVNGTAWCAYPTLDENLVMLPGWDSYDGPEMNPCWAEFTVEEGEFNPLAGHTSIGLATPGVVVEIGRYDHGGIDGSDAVAISRFDDFATAFVDWLLNIKVLKSLWGGDTEPYSPTVRQFADAAQAANHRGHWEDSTEDGDCSRTVLELNLPDALIDQVRDRLSSMNPDFAATLNLRSRES